MKKSRYYLIRTAMVEIVRQQNSDPEDASNYTAIETRTVVIQSQVAQLLMVVFKGSLHQTTFFSVTDWFETRCNSIVIRAPN